MHINYIKTKSIEKSMQSKSQSFILPHHVIQVVQQSIQNFQILSAYFPALWLGRKFELWPHIHNDNDLISKIYPWFIHIFQSKYLKFYPITKLVPRCAIHFFEIYNKRGIRCAKNVLFKILDARCRVVRTGFLRIEIVFRT